MSAKKYFMIPYWAVIDVTLENSVVGLFKSQDDAVFLARHLASAGISGHRHDVIKLSNSSISGRPIPYNFYSSD